MFGALLFPLGFLNRTPWAWAFVVAFVLLMAIDACALKLIKVFRPASRAHQCGAERSLQSLDVADVQQNTIWEGIKYAEFAGEQLDLQVYPLSLKRVPALPSVRVLTLETAPDWVATDRREPVVRFVSANATLANGETCLALVSLYLSDEAERREPTLVAEITSVFVGDQQIVCDGSTASAHEIDEAFAQKQGKVIEAVYPISWRLNVLIEGEDREREGIEFAWS